MGGECRLVDVHRKAVELSDNGRPFAVALVLAATGSTPQKAGVRVVVEGSGEIWGTIGGGLVEAETQRLTIEACRSRRPIVFDLHLDSASASEAGAICGGSMRILIDPTAAEARACYERAAESLERHHRGVLVTTVRDLSGPRVAVAWFAAHAVPSDATFPGAEEIRGCVAREAAGLFVENRQDQRAPSEVLVEPVIPEPRLLIVGGGHVGQALARQAVLVGFDVTVLDDRPEFTSSGLFPKGVATVCGDVAREVAGFPTTSDTYIVVVTRGHKHDAEALAACIHAPAAYIGMIGSERKVRLLRESFLERGLATEEEFGRVFAPIGVDIGAVTVAEIAASIAAQLVAVRRRGDARVARGRGGASPLRGLSMNCAIVLAAGRSRRMGAHKVLLPFGHTTVIGHIVDQLLRSAVGEVLVVVGHNGERVRAELSSRPVRVLANPGYETGMLSSVRCGLRALPQGCDTVLVALGDQPTLTAELVDDMLRAFAATNRGILVPVWRGTRGHPIVFSERHCAEVLTRHDDLGLRGLLRAHPEDVRELSVSAAAVLSDMDTPEDYRRALETLETNSKPPSGPERRR